MPSPSIRLDVRVGQLIIDGADGTTSAHFANLTPQLTARLISAFTLVNERTGSTRENQLLVTVDSGDGPITFDPRLNWLRIITPDGDYQATFSAADRLELVTGLHILLTRQIIAEEQ